jgi:hypothetical protein
VAEDADLQAVGDRIESLLDELRSSADGRVWMRIEELVRLLTELYGAGLARVVELAANDSQLLERMAADSLIGSLLVLHDLHPEDLEQRIVRALNSLDGTLGKASAQAHVAHLDADSRQVQVTVTVAGGGCGSTADAVRQTVADVLTDAVPDADVVVRVESEPAPVSTPVRLGAKPARLGARG